MPECNTLTHDQLRTAAFNLGTDSRGDFFTALQVIILEHFLALGRAGNVAQMESDLATVTDALVKADHYVDEVGGVEAAVQRARDYLPSCVPWAMFDLDGTPPLAGLDE